MDSLLTKSISSQDYPSCYNSAQTDFHSSMMLTKRKEVLSCYYAKLKKAAKLYSSGRVSEW